MPLDDLESDTSYNLVTEDTQNPTFPTMLAGNLTNMIINFIEPIAEVSEIDPEFDSTMVLNWTIGGTWFNLTGLRMTSRGFILISMELDVTLNTTNTINTTNTTNAINSSKSSNISSSSSGNNSNSTNNTSNISNTTNSSTNNSSKTNSSSSAINIFGGRFLQSTTSTYTIPTTTTNSTSSQNSSNISTDSLVLFQPTPAQIKLKLNAYNDTVLISQVAFYNYTDASINITNLNYSTKYRVYYTVSSENPAVYCLLGNEVRSMRIITLENVVTNNFAKVLSSILGTWILLILMVIIMDSM